MKNLKITTKIKILFELIAALVLSLVVSACANPPSDYEVLQNNTLRPEGGVRVVQVSDLHYYSEKLHDNGERYNTIMSSAGGRDALHIVEITDAFIERMK